MDRPYKNAVPTVALVIGLTACAQSKPREPLPVRRGGETVMRETQNLMVHALVNTYDALVEVQSRLARDIDRMNGAPARGAVETAATAPGTPQVWPPCAERAFGVTRSDLWMITPETAFRLGAEIGDEEGAGTAIAQVRFHIDAYGRPIAAAVERESHPDVLKHDAVRAVERWRGPFDQQCRDAYACFSVSWSEGAGARDLSPSLTDGECISPN